MINNPRYNSLFAGGKEDATQEDALEALTAMHALPVPFLDPIDVSNAVVYLASEEGRYITGTAHVIDAGASIPSRPRTVRRPQLATRRRCRTNRAGYRGCDTRCQF